MGFPWAWIAKKENTGDALNTTFLDRENDPVNLGLTGYSIDLLRKLAERMDFDYEIVPAPHNYYGYKVQGITLYSGAILAIYVSIVLGSIDQYFSQDE